MEPLIFDKKMISITIKQHMGQLKLFYDKSKWDAFFGTADSGSSFSLTFSPKNRCKQCGGSGVREESSPLGDGLEWTEPCFRCKGTGYEPDYPLSETPDQEEKE